MKTQHNMIGLVIAALVMLLNLQVAGQEKAQKIDLLEIRWPSGQVDTIKDLPVNQLVTLKEGAGVLRTEKLPVKR